MADERERDEDVAPGTPASPGRGLERRQVGLERTGGLIGRGLDLARELGAAGGSLEPSGPPRLVSISCGWTHALAVDEDGGLYAWGYNGSAQLGLRAARSVLTPTLVSASGISAVSASDESSIALGRDGTLWHWGAGPETGPTDFPRFYQRTPAQVGSDQDWQAISAGGGHALGLKRDGRLWAWGSRNFHGELGHEAITDCSVLNARDRTAFFERCCAAERVGIYNFCPVGRHRDWAAICAGESHSLALKKDGSLWAWGCNESRQLGLGDEQDRREPTRVGADSDWAQVSTYGTYNLALKRDGSLWVWGWSGKPTVVPSEWQLRPRLVPCYQRPDVMAIAQGRGHSLMITRDGRLWAFTDCDPRDQLGLGWESADPKAKQVGCDSDWRAICAGWDSSLALKRDGSLWAWGRNESGQLGVGDRAPRLRPTRVTAFTRPHTDDMAGGSGGRRRSLGT